VEANSDMFDELDAKIREMSEKVALDSNEFDLDDDDEGDDFDIRTLESDDGDED
jgi:hypothetical protein